MASQFSKDGKYFAQISTEGKLKIWNAFSNSFEHEFTPDFHLTSPCTSLHFLQSDSNKVETPQRKKRRSSLSNTTPKIALGTSTGRLIIYSIVKGSLDYIIDSETSLSVNCLSSYDDSSVYSGAHTTVLVWNLHRKCVCDKWNAGNEKIGAILILPNCNNLLTAAKQIILWDIIQKERLRVFTGHSSEVSLLYFVNPMDNVSESYFISGSKRDRLLSCWSLNETVDEKYAVVKFSMEDAMDNLSVMIDSDGSIHIAATLVNGVVLVYQHTLRKSNKVVKHKTRLQVVSDVNSEVISPIHIRSAVHRDQETLCIGYGNSVVQTFENITITTDKKDQCLFRKDPQNVTVSRENQVSKIRTPLIGNDVHYFTSQTSSVNVKRKNIMQIEVPMEKRLENLTLNNDNNSSAVPKSDNLAQLLIQGLHSRDANIIRTVLSKRDETVIRNTLKRLPMPLLVTLIQELTKLIQGKMLHCQIGASWLKHLIAIHAGWILSNTELADICGIALGCIQSRISQLTPLNRLKGRLSLLIAQADSNQEDNDIDEMLLVYNDKDSSDSDEDEDFN